MFGGWRTQIIPLRPTGEGINWNPCSLTRLALWITALALGFVAGSEPGALENLHHIHLSHGNKRHHIVPIAIHRSPASLRAGHSKYSPIYSPVYSNIVLDIVDNFEQQSRITNLLIVNFSF